MPCPKCNSYNLWDDSLNPWWGCQDCDFMSDRIRNVVSPKDRWNVPKKREKED